MENKQKKFRFNIIDVVVILIVAALIAVFAIKFIDRGEVGTASVQKTYDYVVVSDAMSRELYEEIAQSLPAQMVASGAYVNGTVVSAEAEPCAVKELEVKDVGNQNRTYIVEPAEEYVTVRFNCRATVDASSLLNALGTQELRVGRTHYVKTDFIEIVGTIVSMTEAE